MKNSTSIQITNYLIVKSQFYTHGYTVFDNFLPEDVFDGIVGLWEKSNFEEENQILDHYKEYQISGSSYDTYFPTEDEDYLCSYWGSSEITKNTEVGRMGATYIQPILEDIAGRRLLIGNHQANIYKNNGKNHSRVHMDKWGWEAAIGYILFVIKSDWKYDWGGLLHLVLPSAPTAVNTVIPKSNRLVVINHSADITHWITPVNTWAKDDRKTLIGLMK